MNKIVGLEQSLKFPLCDVDSEKYHLLNLVLIKIPIVISRNHLLTVLSIEALNPWRIFCYAFALMHQLNYGWEGVFVCLEWPPIFV